MSASKQSTVIFYLGTSVLLFIFCCGTPLFVDAANETSSLDLKEVTPVQNITSTFSSVSPLVGSSAGAGANDTTPTPASGNVTTSSVVIDDFTTVNGTTDDFTITNGTTTDNFTTGSFTTSNETTITGNFTTGNFTTGNGTTVNVSSTTFHSTTEAQSTVFAFFLWIIFCIFLLAVILCCCSICLKESPEQRARRAHNPANNVIFEDHPSGWVRNDGPRMAHWPQVQPASPFSARIAY